MAAKSYSENQAFTLIELMVVIAIIGLLSSVVLVSMQGAKRKAQVAKVQQDIEAIYKAILLKEATEEVYPSVNNINSASGFKTYLAPYITGMGDDPWGHAYFYDGCPEPCASCGSVGCESGLWQSSVGSAGPDGIFTSHNVVPNGDDIFYIF